MAWGGLAVSGRCCGARGRFEAMDCRTKRTFTDKVYNLAGWCRSCCPAAIYLPCATAAQGGRRRPPQAPSTPRRCLGIAWYPHHKGLQVRIEPCRRCAGRIEQVLGLLHKEIGLAGHVWKALRDMPRIVIQRPGLVAAWTAHRQEQPLDRLISATWPRAVQAKGPSRP